MDWVLQGNSMILNQTQTRLDFSDVLIVPKNSEVSSRSEVDLTFHIKKKKRPTTSWTGVPIIASNMDTTGTFAVSRVLSKHKMLTFLHKHYTADDYINNGFNPEYVGITVGMSDEDFDKTRKILDRFLSIPFICIDVANGYMTKFQDVVRKYAEAFPHKFIVAGNVVTPEGVVKLLDAGADICKIGIGNGSVCTTRLKTGVGYPQFSSLYEIKTNVVTIDAPLISDGGCQNPGDIAKAFGVGSSFVMIGGMLAGHDETGTEIYGMSSGSAMNKYAGGIESYRTEEGKHVTVENKGSLESTVQDILGGLRSACTYTNCKTLQEFIGKQEFIKVNHQVNNMFK